LIFIRRLVDVVLAFRPSQRGEGSHCLFGVHMPLRLPPKLFLSTDGKLELISSSNDPPAVFTISSIRKITLDAYCIGILPSPWSKSEICESLSFLAANNMILCQAKRCALTWALPLPEAGFFKLGNTVLVILQIKRRRWTCGVLPSYKSAMYVCPSMLTPGRC
jgi:hypothetical protein